jgi:hypothetical protein
MSLVLAKNDGGAEGSALKGTYGAAVVLAAVRPVP